MKTSAMIVLSIVLLFAVTVHTREDGPRFRPNTGASDEKCAQRIYSECNYPTTFTYEELENVRQFLNYSFTQLADIKPDKHLCPQLHVRQDWKCLLPEQKQRLINVWKIMYENKDIQRLTDIHARYWPAWHKTHEFSLSHRWLCNEFEKRMQMIDPTVSLPYWDPYTYGAQPERSSIWDTLGHSGSAANGYIVADGIYSNWDLVPTIKRHWLDNGTILPWYTQEFETWLIQASNSIAEMSLITLGIHFNPHLNIGGFDGQYAQRDAPYE